jgi:hypothetical protein
MSGTERGAVVGADGDVDIDVGWDAHAGAGGEVDPEVDGDAGGVHVVVAGRCRVQPW